MIEGLRPYPGYKAIGVPWLRQVPAHWEISRSKRLFSARKELALPGDVQLSATQAYGVIPQSEFEERVGRRVVRISMHLEKRRHVEKDDFVISMRSFQGGLERAWASGAIRSSYVVLKAQAGVDVGYFAHLFKSQGYIRALQATADFIRDGQDLNFNNFASVALPLPPRAEQAIIGRFLDHANQRIDRFIRTKRKLIALLNEQKQAIIHRTVTRGIDPGVRTKDSGVPWLGEIPAHWTMPLMGRHVTRIEQGWSPVAAEGELELDQWAVLTLSSVRRGAFDPSAVKPIASSAEVPSDLALRDGDFLLTRSNTRERVGDVCTVKNVRDRTILCDLIYRLSFQRNLIEPAFMAYQLLAPVGRYQIERDARGSSGTMPKIAQSHIRSWRVLVPPIQEQREIIARIEHETTPVVAALSHAECQIALIREYRTRLIADVVTGQLDVREAAARLPTCDLDEPAPAALDDDATGDELDEGEPE